jgi:mono/diheme cytochrome c family protein
MATALAVAVSRAEPPAPAAPAAEAADPVPKLLQSADDVARGKALFTGTCGAYCHRPAEAGDAGGGQSAAAPNLFGCEWRHGGSNAQIFQTISQGVAGTRMVPFGGAVPDEDIWRIVAYLKSATQCKPQL